MRIKILSAAALLSAATIAAAFAHSGATGIVKQRMDAMGKMAKAMEALTSIMRGDVAYDAQKVKENASVIKAHSGNAISSLFPEGSLNKPSVAKAEIWSDWDVFVELSDRLELYAAGLEQAAENGLMQRDGNMPMAGSGMMGNGAANMPMGSGMMMNSGRQAPTAEMLASMPADGVFGMVAQTCSDCHTKYRIEKK